MPPVEPLLNPISQQFLVFLFLVFGSLLGSFSNVVILRMAEGKSVVFPPSSCPHCRHQLSPLDLIPIFGWIFLRGKCRYCSAPISIQYPLVETAAALTLAAAFLSAGFSVKLVPQAAWGMITLIVAMLWFRGDVVHPLPYVSPLGYRIFLLWWAGSTQWSMFGEAAVFAGISTALFAVRHRNGRWIPFFGVGMNLLLGASWLGLPFQGALIAISGLSLAFPLSQEKGMEKGRAPLFFWAIAGMLACGLRGNWGF